VKEHSHTSSWNYCLTGTLSILRRSVSNAGNMYIYLPREGFEQSIPLFRYPKAVSILDSATRLGKVA